MTATATEKKTTTRTYTRKKVSYEQVTESPPDPTKYELVTFRFYNEEQRGVPIEYEWVDRYTKMGQCKGTFHDGQTYTLPRCAYEYYKECSIPKYGNEEREMVPGQVNRVSVEKGRIYRFRLDEVR